MSPRLAIRNFNMNAGGNMLQIYKTRKQMLNLQLGLREFGLKPVEWRIVKRNRSQFVIQNATANDLYFVGEVKPSNDNQWKYIQLAGIY